MRKGHVLADYFNRLQMATGLRLPLREIENPIPGGEEKALAIGDFVLVCHDRAPGGGNRYLLICQPVCGFEGGDARADAYLSSTDVFTNLREASERAIGLFVELSREAVHDDIPDAPGDEKCPGKHWKRLSLICSEGWFTPLVDADFLPDESESVARKFGFTPDSLTPGNLIDKIIRGQL